MVEAEAEETKEFEEPGGDEKCEPGAEETNESEEPGEESLELRKLKSLMKSDEHDDPQGACLILIFFKVFIII